VAPEPGIAGGIKRPDFVGRLVNEPKTVAPDARHMRIDDSNRRPHRHHGLDGIATLLQNRTARFGGQMMGAATAARPKRGDSFITISSHFNTYSAFWQGAQP